MNNYERPIAEYIDFQSEEIMQTINPGESPDISAGFGNPDEWE